MIFLDYRACGPQGEPAVVHVDQENAYKITHLADSFDVLDEPKAEPSCLLSQLPDKLREQGLELSTDPEAYLERCV